MKYGDIRTKDQSHHIKLRAMQKMFKNFAADPTFCINQTDEKICSMASLLLYYRKPDISAFAWRMLSSVRYSVLESMFLSDKGVFLHLVDTVGYMYTIPRYNAKDLLRTLVKNHDMYTFSLVSIKYIWVYLTHAAGTGVLTETST